MGVGGKRRIRNAGAARSWLKSFRRSGNPNDHRSLPCFHPPNLPFNQPNPFSTLLPLAAFSSQLEELELDYSLFSLSHLFVLKSEFASRRNWHPRRYVWRETLVRTSILPTHMPFRRSIPRIDSGNSGSKTKRPRSTSATWMSGHPIAWYGSSCCKLGAS